MDKRPIGQNVVHSENVPVVNPKNVYGKLGPICNFCGGLGFTLNITSGSQGCQRCDQTGIEPVNTHELKKDVEEIKKLLLKLIKKQNE